jgi:DnaJ-class molecular chaperone
MTTGSSGGEHTCPTCGGEGVVYDHRSLDPQQRWDDTCADCAGTGLVPDEELAA